VLEVDAFHSWYVEPGDVKKALDGGEIMCGVFVGRPSGWGLLSAGGLVGPDLVARLRKGTDED